MLKVIAIFYLLLLFVSSGGYFLIYQGKLYQLQEEKWEEASHLNGKSVTSFSFPVQDVRFANFELNKAKQFIENGNYYDVISIQKLANQIIITATKDDEEQELENKFLAINKNQTKNSDNDFLHLMTQYFSILFLSQNKLNISLYFTYLKNKNINYSYSFYSSVSVKIFTPPPEF